MLLTGLQKCFIIFSVHRLIVTRINFILFFLSNQVVTAAIRRLLKKKKTPILSFPFTQLHYGALTAFLPPFWDFDPSCMSVYLNNHTTSSGFFFFFRLYSKSVSPTSQGSRFNNQANCCSALIFCFSRT